MHWDGLSWFYSFSAFYLKHLKNPQKKSKIFCSFFNIYCIYKMIPLKPSPALSAKCDEMFKKNFHTKVYWSYLWRVCKAFHLPCTSVSGGGKPKKRKKKKPGLHGKGEIQYMIWKQTPKRNWKVVWQIFSVISEDGTRCKEGRRWEMSGQLSLIYLRRSRFLRGKLIVDIIHRVGPQKRGLSLSRYRILFCIWSYHDSLGNIKVFFFSWE